MKDPHKIIDHLSPTDALSILRTLAASDKQLARRIAEIATAHLSEVTHLHLPTFCAIIGMDKSRKDF